MSKVNYRIDFSAPLNQELQRLAREQIDFAVAQIKNFEREPNAVHETRKAMKRLRALLRAMKPGLRRKHFKTEQKRARDIARALGSTRDRQVLADTLAHLKIHSRGIAKTHIFKQLQAWLSAAQQSEANTVPESKRDILLQQLQDGAEAVARLKTDKIDFDTLLHGIENCYDKAKSAFTDAHEADIRDNLDLSNTLYHEYRKHVQSHWRHMLLLHDAWPAEFKVRISVAKSLSDKLGLDHDLAVLGNFLQTANFPGRKNSNSVTRSSVTRSSVTKNKTAKRAFLHRIEGRQQQIRAEIWDTGRLMFAETPRAIRLRMEGYVETARDRTVAQNRQPSS